MNAPVLSPAHTEEPTTRLAKANEARGRKIQVVDVSHLGLTREADKAVAKIAFRVNTKGEEERAVFDAHKHVERLGKGTEAAKDPDITTEAKLVYALWSACREVGEDGQPTISGAFPGPQWMRDNLDNDELAALLNIYNDVRFRKSSQPYEFTDDEVERIMTVCADGAATEIPTAFLAGLPREIVAQYLILAAVKLRKARSELLTAQMRLEQYEPTEEAPAEEAAQ